MHFLTPKSQRNNSQNVVDPQECSGKKNESRIFQRFLNDQKDNLRDLKDFIAL